MAAWDNGHRKARLHASAPGDHRSEFERDRDRLLYSSAFHRLAGITQIVRAGEANVFHTRQQHTIKVAQVGRRLAQRLLKVQRKKAAYRGLDPEVVEAACIAHDLGHPPFGHIGESTLNELVSVHDDDGFEGNAQSFRIITKLAVRYSDFDGINLTRATLAACLKYPWFREHAGAKSKKWSAYRTEKEEFEFARDGLAHENKTLEAELMDWADDVAYSVHDLEDFHRCNALPWTRVREEREDLIKRACKNSYAQDEARFAQAFDRIIENFFYGTYSELLSEAYEGTRLQREQLRRMTSTLIGKYIAGISINEDLDNSQAVVFQSEHVDEIAILKQITRDYIIDSPALIAQQHGQKLIIKQLFEDLLEAKKSSDGCPAFLPTRLRYLQDLGGTSRKRFVADCIASLSESEAVALHARLRGISSGSVLDPIVR